MTEDARNPDSPQPTATVWSSTLDGRYAVTVLHTAHPALGRLLMVDGQTGVTLLDEQVPLSFGATFGPDIMDIEDWQQWGIAVIDGL